MIKSSSNHWNNVFKNAKDEQLGWYEDEAKQTSKLLDFVPTLEKSSVFIPGVGTSVLVEELCLSGCKLILNDISIEALERLKEKLGNKSDDVMWICQDISNPLKDDIPSIDVWIDRAVLHFLLEEADIQGYFNNLKDNLRSGGFVLFAEFSITGVNRCAGLPLHQYSTNELSNRLGEEFKLVEEEEYDYINMDGDKRPYLYALYRRED